MSISLIGGEIAISFEVLQTLRKQGYSLRPLYINQKFLYLLQELDHYETEKILAFDVLLWDLSFWDS
jgi:hypothetical protein